MTFTPSQKYKNTGSKIKYQNLTKTPVTHTKKC